jgi:hypothetical protein
MSEMSDDEEDYHSKGAGRRVPASRRPSSRPLPVEPNKGMKSFIGAREFLRTLFLSTFSGTRSQGVSSSDSKMMLLFQQREVW